MLRFGHAENIIPMVSVLNLFHDSDELRADNFKQNLGRKFRTGDFSPFSANLAFVLHRCPHDESRGDDVNSQFKIHVLLNELPIKIIDGGELACVKMNGKNFRLAEDGSLCDLRHFRAQIEKFVDEDFNHACALKPSEKSVSLDDEFDLDRKRSEKISKSEL